MKKKRKTHIAPVDRENNTLTYCDEDGKTTETQVSSKEAREMIESLKHLEA
ncbi:MAG: hypothetical protein ACE5J0_02025 [Candidatus Paceibacterales bacterium]